MTIGLQVYGADGSIWLDATKRLPRVVGTLTLNGSGNATNESLGYPHNKLWYVITSNISPADNIENTPVLRITENGTKLVWQNQVGTVIKYGVY